MRSPARVWYGTDPMPELTDLVRQWLNRNNPPPQRPRTLLDVLGEQAPDMTNHDDDDHDNRPLTQDELRHQAIQDRLMAELREVEEKLGHRVDLLANGEWIN